MDIKKIVGINDPLTHYDFMRNIISATFSTLPDQLVLKRNLDDRVARIYDENPHQLLSEHRFNGWTNHGIYNRNDLVYDIISMSGGRWVGLSNWGFDYDFHIERYTKKIGNTTIIGLDDMVECSKEVLGERDFAYFAELGNQLDPMKINI